MIIVMDSVCVCLLISRSWWLLFSFIHLLCWHQSGCLFFSSFHSIEIVFFCCCCCCCYCDWRKKNENRNHIDHFTMNKMKKKIKSQTEKRIMDVSFFEIEITLDFFFSLFVSFASNIESETFPFSKHSHTHTIHWILVNYSMIKCPTDQSTQSTIIIIITITTNRFITCGDIIFVVVDICLRKFFIFFDDDDDPLKNFFYSFHYLYRIYHTERK